MTTALTIYGIANCDTVKKARAWLGAQDVPVIFHDYKKQGVPADRLAAWMGAVGWETLLNRQGTTWRKLDEVSKAAIVDESTAKDVMLAHPSLIKRPVIERNGQLLAVGFAPDKLGAFLNL